jgi:GNAT superfamily N-acetyltransferase
LLPFRNGEVRIVTGGGDLETIRQLFHEYETHIGVDLCFQGFAAELAGLPGEYAAPTGVLLLAGEKGEGAGCVAVRRWAPDACEMKRLFVRPAFQGSGLGRRLAEEIIAWARGQGYARVLLDTLPSMGTAQALYERLGFRDVAPYRANPVAGARYMGLTL